MFTQLVQPAQTARVAPNMHPAMRSPMPHAPAAPARYIEANSWQRRAVVAYEQAEHRDAAALQWELADRIAALTEQEIAPESIYVNRAAQLAVVNVEGVVFRLQGHTLAVVRPCVECGTGHFESRALSTVQDLGYALGAWEPRCEHCAPADPANWLEYED